jgi:adenylosuccinate lyase
MSRQALGALRKRRKKTQEENAGRKRRKKTQEENAGPQRPCDTKGVSMPAIGRIVGVLAVVLLGADAVAAERTMAELFGRPHTQELLMQMEVALARVQARRGIIPAAAADEIARTANLKDVPPQAVAEEFRKVGHPMVALLNVWARATKDGAGEWIHYGATTQDIFDTVYVMQTREAARMVIRDLRRLEEIMIGTARTHRATPMIGRTVGRHALPITFGMKVASWIAENRRNIERLKAWVARTDTGMLSGAVGSYAALGPNAFAIEAEVMKELGLGEPWPADWKGAKDMFADYGLILTVTAKTLGKIGQEIFLLQEDDTRELEDPSDAVGSSTMPHKVNPRFSRAVVQHSRVVPHQAEVLLDWMISIHERDQISNADTLGEISVTMDRQLKAAISLMEVLKVHPENMARNLNRTGGLIMAEHAMFLLGEKIGKHTAHEEVRLAARAAWERGTNLTDEIAKRPGLAKWVEELDLRNQLDPTKYLGLAPESVDRTIAAVQKARAAAGDAP